MLLSKYVAYIFLKSILYDLYSKLQIQQNKNHSEIKTQELHIKMGPEEGNKHINYLNIYAKKRKIILF